MGANHLLLYRIAYQYYINHYSQEEIAKKENISRPQISRLLKQACEQGIVHFTVELPDSEQRVQIKKTLLDRFHLKDVIISPSTPDKEENNKTLYLCAATYLSSVLPKHHKIGIGWGQTLYNTAIQLQYTNTCDDMTFYPVIGSAGISNPNLQTNTICDRFAEKFHAKIFFNNYPTITPANIPDNYLSTQLKQLEQFAKELDALVISLGGTLKSNDYVLKELPQKVLQKLREEQLIGDILSHFVCKTRPSIYKPVDFQFNTIGLKQIKKVEDVYCIVHGIDKTEIIKYALDNGYIKTLITDCNTALSLLQI